MGSGNILFHYTIAHVKLYYSYFYITVNDALLTAKGALFTVHGARRTAHGALRTVHGVRCKVHDARRTSIQKQVQEFVSFNYGIMLFTTNKIRIVERFILTNHSPLIQ